MFARCIVCRLIMVVLCWISLAGWAKAEDPPSAVGPLMTLLKSGRLPKERVGTVLEMICTRGNEHDLSYVFQQLTSAEGYQGEMRLKAMRGLVEAAESRKVRPAGDLSKLGNLLTGDADKDTRLTALKLAGLWKPTGLDGALKKLALGEQQDKELFTNSLDALVSIEGVKSQSVVEQLLAAGRPQWQRYLAVAALARFNLDAAAKQAAAVLKDGTAADDPAPLLDAFFIRKGGSEKLAAAVADQTLSEDVLKMCLRYMYATGRNAPELSAALSKVPDPPPPTPDDIKRLSAEVAASGDAGRGEAIFRRADLSCLRCHAIHKAGGDVGPDLESLGITSPIEYVVTSILLPSQAIKEQYLTAIVATTDGEIFHGIVVEKSDEQMILKDANGKRIRIAAADIDDKAEGKSLMPDGLTKFLTHQELLDLARFISELGKPGPYAIPATTHLQRFRVLKNVPPDVASEVPNVEIVREKILAAGDDQWSPTYAQVSGVLPLKELSPLTVQNVLYLQGAVDVNEEGELTVQLDDAAGVSLWVDAEPFEGQRQTTVSLAPGVHTLTFRVDLAQRKATTLSVELLKPDNSTAQFTAVGGR